MPSGARSIDSAWFMMLSAALDALRTHRVCVCVCVCVAHVSVHLWAECALVVVVGGVRFGSHAPV
jgi:hypothetical protein